MFDCKYMKDQTLESVKDGLILCLLGSDKPIVESLSPNNIKPRGRHLKTNSRECQIFHLPIQTMSRLRESIIKKVNDCLTNTDKDFLVSFEDGTPQWDKCCQVI